MRTKWISYGLILVLWAALARGQDQEMGVAVDTNFYVAGVVDWKGNLTVQVLSALDFAQFKKDVELDNRALTIAYQNIRQDWKTQHTKATATANDPKARIPSFPLKRPAAKLFRSLGKFPTTEAAEVKKKYYEEAEAARLKRAEEASERALKEMPEGKKAALEEKTGVTDKLLESLQAEMEKVKLDLSTGTNPSREKESASKSGSSGSRTVTFRQGPRVGEGIDKPLVTGGDLIGGGALKK